MAHDDSSLVQVAIQSATLAVIVTAAFMTLLFFCAYQMLFRPRVIKSMMKIKSQ